jgi:hypothetical protein
MVRRHIRPTKPSVSLSSEMGERNGCGSWNVATTRAAFAGPVRNGSREVGQCERASVCSTARTPPKMEGEVGEEGKNCKERGSVSVQHRAQSSLLSPGWLGFGQRSRVELG